MLSIHRVAGGVQDLLTFPGVGTFVSARSAAESLVAFAPYHPNEPQLEVIEVASKRVLTVVALNDAGRVGRISFSPDGKAMAYLAVNGTRLWVQPVPAR